MNINKEKFNSNITQLKYIKTNSCQNLGESIVQLPAGDRLLKSFINEKTGLAVVFSAIFPSNTTKVLNKHLLSFFRGTEIHEIASQYQKKKNSKIEKKLESDSKTCNMCNKFTCPICYQRELHYLKIKRTTGSLSEGIYYKQASNIFLLLGWLFARLDSLQSQHNMNSQQCDQLLSDSRKTAREMFGEAHNIFPSVVSNIIFFDFIQNPLILNEENEIIIPIIRGGASLFLKKNKRLCCNHKQVLKFHSLQFKRDFQVLPSEEGRNPGSTQSKFLQFASQFLSKVRTFNPITVILKILSPPSRILDNRQPEYRDTISAGIVNIYRYVATNYTLNQPAVDKRLKKLVDTERTIERKKTPEEISYLYDFDEVQGEVNYAEISDEQNFDIKLQTHESNISLISWSRFINQKLFNRFIPKNVLHFCEKFSFKPIIKLYNTIPVSDKVQDFMSETFPLQKTSIAENLSSSNSDMIIHSLSGVFISSSFIQSQTFLERLINKYSNAEQVDFAYFHQLAGEPLQVLRYFIFEKIIHQKNYTVNKKYLNFTFEEKQKFESSIKSYDAIYTNKNQLQAITARFVELTTYFRLSVFEAKGNSRPVSYLERLKFNEIINFMVFEALLVTQIDFCKEKHTQIIHLEKLFEMVNHPSYHRILHSFSFKKKSEVSKGRFIKELIFKFPTQQTFFAKEFIRASQDNINLVLGYTSIPPIKQILPWQ